VGAASIFDARSDIFLVPEELIINMNAPRPLSPHLSVYRFAHTMLLSVLHRATGIVLTVALLGVVSWLLALAVGPASYARVMSLWQSPLGWIVRVGLLASIAYHLCAGIRHLIFDAGYALEKGVARRAGQWVVGVAVLLTVLSVVWMCCAGAAV
jgi:succinate dehydrogenase / fumarate reductase cytochrome b subunit